MTTTAPAGPPPGAGPAAASGTDGTALDKGLKGGSLGLVGSVVVGLASTAPAYSLAAALGFVVTGLGDPKSGFKAPAIMLLAFVPMYFIAVAYKELNEAEPDCGTTFTWATRAFGPIVGWMGGWGIIVADVIVMANLAQIAGSYSFSLMGDIGWTTVGNWSTNVFASTVAGILWIVIMTYICYRGIEISARIQYGLLVIEVITLVMFAVVALVKVYSNNGVKGLSTHPSLSWFWPGGLSFTHQVAPAVLAAMFIYWGWDTAVATNEETADPGKTPGRAAVISTVLLLITYLLVSTAAVAFAGPGVDGIGIANPNNSSDVFAAMGKVLFGDSVLGHVGLFLLTISVLTSASASTQTTILPTARTALSMAAYRAIPTNFAKIHKKYLTPTWATIGMGVVSILFYLLITWISPKLLVALIDSVGLQIAFYYGLTGIACVWFYRRTLLSSPRHMLMRGLIPLVGGIFLFVMFVYGLIQYAAPDWATDANGDNITIFGIGATAVVGVLALVIGFPLIALQAWRSSDFFRGKTLPRAHADLVLLGVVEGIRSTTPGSGQQSTVISPDLSNLPSGQIAIDPETGQTYRGDTP